ncbi:alpha-amylase [Clostridium tagluense]|uniref:alpha-amylase n=1 Tax=Clostridium tagluense TaxID=360422 RepID=UPI001CF314EB|nr:alpha-amylase [Clostridium tagluense]MCB2313815.1 alpha-amylase [Clostridium tagluense]MCB2318635.1 alpha-amylase [Clostridium tagluense]MCB2323510.1 alpha-amylase [Clostridium tagluense]MCB2328379.1 alpha-amylase [Clostridium tagluense]MCB2333229.1 alpha-amylase [Clostridium tagluense]
MNRTIMQFFEWYLPSDGGHWNFLKQHSKELSDVGINTLWLPPAYKGGGGINDTGYGVYDLYDLGEFDQKSSVRTKYGTKEQYIEAIAEAHKNNIEVIGDIVLNQKGGADDTEWVKVVKVEPTNRNNKISGEYDIKAWTKYNFAGRNNKYSDFKWNWEHFNGVDWDENKKESAIFQFTGLSKGWDQDVDSENGNYDYLMLTDVDVSSTVVCEELLKWGLWYIEIAKLDGFRLDAVKHIDYEFFNKWINDIRNITKKEMFTVGEYWSADLNILKKYVEDTNHAFNIFDVPLHYNFFSAAKEKENYDLRGLMSNTLISCYPENSVTFVNNHDTQPGQSLESFVDKSFSLQAYTFILTRQEGIPCIFFGDYYGIPNNDIAPLKDPLDKLLKARRDFAYGWQHDYFDDAHIVGWTREKGLAALISNGNNGGSKKMFLGEDLSGKTFVDITGNSPGEIKIAEDGNGDFTVNGNSYSVWCMV